MRIWKCDKCGTVLEKDTDVFVVSCGAPRELDDKAACEAGIKSITYYKEYDLCCVCASEVTTAIFVSTTKEWYPNCDAWMPLPEPYKEEGERNE